ncbi:MAG: nicotinamide-nucleotide amidohydrolase family protein [Gammaproteobacteria bacterium]|nr:nicotinamide-nucleotide amidohydrolase family protein [Gammaproteobacteria bacterium]
MEQDIRRLARRLHATGLTVAAAESCTGGWLAKCLTDLPGSSQWFLAGWVCYRNESKNRHVGVPLSALRRHGAVSEPVVRALARAALRRSGADLAVAISGIAGPGGAVPGKPVGTVWFAFARKHNHRMSITAVVKRFRGDRNRVRRKAVVFALRGLYSCAS